jgi:hypothetical protein
MNLWKETLSSDGMQFHQYQQNEHPYFILTHSTKNENISRHMTLEIQALALNIH